MMLERGEGRCNALFVWTIGFSQSHRGVYIALAAMPTTHFPLSVEYMHSTPVFCLLSPSREPGALHYLSKESFKMFLVRNCFRDFQCFSKVNLKMTTLVVWNLKSFPKGKNT